PVAPTGPLPYTSYATVAPAASLLLVHAAGAADAVLVGSGFTDPAASVALLDRVLPHLRTAVVLDALASAYLTAHPDGLEHLAGRAVLTVNPSELAHVAGCAEDDVRADPAAVSRQVAAHSGTVVVCGGTAKHIAAPDGGCWVVEGGGPGLGVSGSGEVLAGVVAGLLARGAGPAQAAVWGSAVHARLGEVLAARVGTLGYLARDLPPCVPGVLTELA
ncbi:MAG: ADP-dependent NAD(P)H-hydrate dehydratase, partial [Marmoricola sp.]